MANSRKTGREQIERNRKRPARRLPALHHFYTWEHSAGRPADIDNTAGFSAHRSGACTARQHIRTSPCEICIGSLRRPQSARGKKPVGQSARQKNSALFCARKLSIQMQSVRLFSLRETEFSPSLSLIPDSLCTLGMPSRL